MPQINSLKGCFLITLIILLGSSCVEEKNYKIIVPANFNGSLFICGYKLSDVDEIKDTIDLNFIKSQSVCSPEFWSTPSRDASKFHVYEADSEGNLNEIKLFIDEVSVDYENKDDRYFFINSAVTSRGVESFVLCKLSQLDSILLVRHVLIEEMVRANCCD